MKAGEVKRKESERGAKHIDNLPKGQMEMFDPIIHMNMRLEGSTHYLKKEINTLMDVPILHISTGKTFPNMINAIQGARKNGKLKTTCTCSGEVTKKKCGGKFVGQPYKILDKFTSLTWLDDFKPLQADKDYCRAQYGGEG